MSVVAPLIISAEKTAQDKYASLPLANWIIMAGVTMMLAIAITAYWSPSPRRSASGGRSSGS